MHGFLFRSLSSSLKVFSQLDSDTVCVQDSDDYDSGNSNNSDVSYLCLRKRLLGATSQIGILNPILSRFCVERIDLPTRSKRIKVELTSCWLLFPAAS